MCSSSRQRSCSSLLQRGHYQVPAPKQSLGVVSHTGTCGVQASLLTARAGFDAVFFARADYDDLARRKAAGQAEAIWRAAPATYGTAGDVFVGNFPNHYGPPHGFNFEWGSVDPPVQVCPAP